MSSDKPSSSAGLRKLPWFSLAFVGIALAVSVVPGVGELLQYDRGEVCKGEVWRLLTGQLVHWTLRMTLVDLAAVLLLGAVVERRSRSLLVSSCFVGLISTGLGIHLMAPHIRIYRGASGMAATLFIVLVLSALSERKTLGTRTLGALALGLGVAKFALESDFTGGLLAGPFPKGVAVLPLAHLIGGLSGVGLFAMSVLPRTVLPAPAAQRGQIRNSLPGHLEASMDASG